MISTLPILLIPVLTLIKSSSSITMDPDPVGVHYHSPVLAPEPAPPYEHPQTTPHNASGTASTNASRIQTSSAAPAQSTAASQRGAGDPCGPSNQTDFESTLNTCGQINTTYPQGPSTYGVQCLYMNPSWHQVINTTSCASNIDDICLKMTSSKATVSQWNWSSGGPNCTAGFWFNPRPAAQPAISFSNCKNYIYGLMRSTCFQPQGGPFNVAAVNLQTLPAVGTSGSQVDSGYPSYIIVPETYDDGSAD